MIKITYIAGPMRGYPRYNFEAFYDAEQALSLLGWSCINPARMDMEEHPGIENPDDLALQKTFVYAERDLNALLDLSAIQEYSRNVRCAVHFLPGWHLSKGAKAEHAVAEWLGLERIYL